MVKTVLSSLLLIIALGSQLAAAPQFLTQPSSSYAAKGGTYTYSFSVRASSDITWSFPDGSPETLFMESGGSTNTNQDGDVYTVTVSFTVNADEGTRGTFRAAVKDSSGTTLSDPFTGTVVSGIFRFGQNHGNGYFQQTSLGLVYAGNPPFVYQENGLGWFALNPGASVSAWIYSLDTNLGWMYTLLPAYPWLYIPSEDSWAYFLYENNLRNFFIARTGQWIVR